MTAIEPATPTLLPPAPEVASAAYEEADGASASTVRLAALIVVLPETNAFVVTTATLTATAMPYPEVGSLVGGASPMSAAEPSSVNVVTAPSVVSSFTSPLAVPRYTL